MKFVTPSFLPRTGPLETPSAPVAPARRPLGTDVATILLVDDEPVIRNLGVTGLERSGYRVLVAGDGDEAIEVYRREAGGIDLVILDESMPRVSGRAALRELRQLDPNVAVIFTSGYHLEPLTAEEPGVVGYVAKPFRLQELGDVVRQALARRRVGDPSLA